MKYSSAVVLLLGLTAAHVAYAVKMKAPDADLETEADAQTLEELEHRIEGALYQVSNTLEKAEQGQAGEAEQVEAGAKVGINPLDYDTEVKWFQALFDGAGVTDGNLACAEVEDNYWMSQIPPVPHNAKPPSRMREAEKRNAADKAEVKAKCALQGDKCTWCIQSPIQAAINNDDGECLRPEDCKCAKRESYEVQGSGEVVKGKADCEVLGAEDTCQFVEVEFNGMKESMCMDKFELKIVLEASCKNPAPGSDSEKNCQMWGWLIDLLGAQVGEVLFKVAVQVTKVVEIPIKAIGGQDAVDAFEGVLIRF